MLLESLLLCVFTLGALAQEATSTSSSSATAETTATSTSSSSAAAETTVNLFLGPGANIGDAFIGSVVNADPCATIYGLACTSGLEENPYCQPSLTVHATYGQSSYGLTTTSGGNIGGVTSLTQGCHLYGTTSAICSVTYTISSSGRSSGSSSVTTLSGQQVVFDRVPITAGASKLSGLASCTSTSSTSNAAAATPISQLYKLLVVPGAAALLGGL